MTDEHKETIVTYVEFASFIYDTAFAVMKAKDYGPTECRHFAMLMLGEALNSAKGTNVSEEKLQALMQQMVPGGRA